MNLDAKSIRIMSFNIRCENPHDGTNSWGNRKEYLCDLVNFHSADIIGFQEVLKAQLDYISKRLKDYDYFGVGRDDGVDKGEFLPIFYVKEKFDLINKGYFWLSETPDIVGSIGWDACLTRVVTWAKLLDKKHNRELFVFNAHFDHLGEIAAEQSSILISKKIDEIVDKTPVILVGDFNSSEKTKIYQNIIKSGFKDCAAEVSNYGSDITFHNFDALLGFFNKQVNQDNSLFEKMSIIDYIFSKNRIKVLQHAILTDNLNGLYPSDHMPKVCDFLLI